MRTSVRRVRFPSQETLTAVAATVRGTRHDWRLRLPLRPQRPAPGLSLLGPVILVVSSLIGWIPLSEAVGKEGDVAFSLFVGSVSIMFMAWSNVLSTRVSWLEPMFGGLDTMYRWHRWVGALSVGAMWLHVQMVDDVRGIPGASRDIADAAEDLAETATNILYVLVAISVLRLIPTRWWRLSHKLLVVPYAIACWHFFTATKPYANGSPWGIWFAIAMMIGVVAWIYRAVWRDMIHRGIAYRVTTIDTSHGNAVVELRPFDQPIHYQQGQFVFLKWHKRGGSEPHPFTISSSPSEPHLRFVIRDLGDWTRRFITEAHVGDFVTVEGPYGRMNVLPRRPKDTVVWIAGGVGITPFLGQACSHEPHNGPIPILFYCVHSREESPVLQDLQRARDEGRIDLRIHASNEDNRLTPTHLEKEFGPAGLTHAHVAMCGPDSLLRQMIPAVQSLGAQHVHVEAFDIRSGVGPDISRYLDDIVRSITKR